MKLCRCLAVLLVLLQAHGVKIGEATTEHIVLQLGAQPNHREYRVWLNVCETEECEWWPPEAVLVYEGWQQEDITIRWEDIDKTARAGYTARIYWSCTVRLPEGGLAVLFQCVDKLVAGSLYLPTVRRKDD